MPKSTPKTAKQKSAVAKAKVTKAVNQTVKKAKTAKASVKRKATTTAKKAKAKTAPAKAKATRAVKKIQNESGSLIHALAEGLEAIKETILPTTKSKKK